MKKVLFLATALLLSLSYLALWAGGDGDPLGSLHIDGLVAIPAAAGPLAAPGLGSADGLLASPASRQSPAGALGEAAVGCTPAFCLDDRHCSCGRSCVGNICQF